MTIATLRDCQQIQRACADNRNTQERTCSILAISDTRSTAALVTMPGLFELMPSWHICSKQAPSCLSDVTSKSGQGIQRYLESRLQMVCFTVMYKCAVTIEETLTPVKGGLSHNWCRKLLCHVTALVSFLYYWHCAVSATHTAAYRT